jgi:hypothetical protein
LLTTTNRFGVLQNDGGRYGRHVLTSQPMGSP